MLSLKQLRSETTRKVATDWLITKLTELGFQTTGWQPGRIQHTLLTMVGTGVSSFANLAGLFAEAGFSETARGAFLTLRSRSSFDNERTPAVPTAGPMTLKSSATVPYTIGVGQLIVRDNLGTRFGNTTG